MPAGLFSAPFMTIVFQMADRLNWWTVKETIFPLSNFAPLLYNFYIISPIIILYFTFNRFIYYMFANAILDVIYAFGVMNWYEYLGIFEFNQINSVGRFLIMQFVAVLIYVYQKWQDPIFPVKTTDQ